MAMTKTMAMTMWALVGLCLLTTAPRVAATTDASNVIVLTTENFEHLTQAATGATTGDWLVEFYAPWCGHCRKLEPIYEKVAEELKDMINVAKVDATANSELGKRFNVRGYPTILLFRQGKMYKFAGKRSVEELSRFARSGYKTMTSQPVPAQPTFVSRMQEHVVVIHEDFVGLMSTKKNVLLVTFGGGLFVGLLLGWLCSCSSRSAPPKAKAKAN